MQSPHTLETGHNLVVSGQDSEWNGFCFDCVLDFIIKELYGKLEISNEPVELLSQCLKDIQSYYSTERVDRMILDRVFEAVSRSSVDSLAQVADKLWSAFAALVVLRISDNSDTMKYLVHQTLKDVNILNSVHFSWWKFLQVKLLRRAQEKTNTVSEAQVDALTSWKYFLWKAVSQHDTRSSYAIDIADVGLRMETVRCVALLAERSSSLLGDDAALIEALLIELHSDYTAILSAHNKLSITSDLSLQVYRRGLFYLITRSLEQSVGDRVAGAQPRALADCFVSQQHPRHVLTQVVHCALALSSSVLPLGSAVEGLQCVRALLLLAAHLGPPTAAHVAGRLLAEDCNYSSKLFGLLEQTSPSSDEDAACAMEQIASSTFLLLAEGCPGRYFHYSLFTHTVCTYLFQRYITSVQALTAACARSSPLQPLGGPLAASTVAVSAVPKALQSLLVCAVQQGVCSLATSTSMLTDCAAHLLLKHQNTGEAAGLAMLSCCLPLIEALCRHTCCPSATETAPAVEPAIHCAQLALQLISRAIAVISLSSLRSDLRDQLRVAVVACLRCVAGLLHLPSSLSATSFTDTAYASIAQLVSFAAVRMLPRDQHSSTLEWDTVFLALVELLACPSLWHLHRPACYSRLLHAQLANTFLSRVSLTCDQAVVDTLSAAYSTFLTASCGSIGGQVEAALRNGLHEVVRVLRADPACTHRETTSSSWSIFEAAHVACILAAPSDSAEVLPLHIYLAACLDSSGTFLGHLPCDPSWTCSSPASVYEAMLLMQGLLLLQHPARVCTEHPRTVRAVVRRYNEAAVDASSVSAEALLTFSVLLHEWGNISCTLTHEPIWGLLHCDAADLLSFWATCESFSVDLLPHPHSTGTFAEAMYSLLVKQVVSSVLNADRKDQGREARLLCAVGQLGRDLPMRTAAGLDSISAALESVVSIIGELPKSDPACARLCVFVLHLSGRLSEVVPSLRGTSTSTCDAAARVLQRVEQCTDPCVDALLSAVYVQWLNVTFYVHFKATLSSVETNDCSEGETGTITALELRHANENAANASEALRNRLN